MASEKQEFLVVRFEDRLPGNSNPYTAYGKITAMYNKAFDRWMRDVSRYLENVNDWERRKHLDRNGYLVEAPTFPKKPKMYKAVLQRISARDFKKIIEENNLVLCTQTSDGRIYDSITRAFMREYYGEIDLDNI